MLTNKATLYSNSLEKQRVIGQYTTGHEGPVLVVISNMHGNEPAGHVALQRVFAHLHKSQPDIKGRCYGLSGNRSALQTATRYVDSDLNRLWTSDRLPLLQRQQLNGVHTHEEKEMYALYHTLQWIGPPSEHPHYVLDLHTTSAASAPFFIMGDTIRNRAFAAVAPIPIVLGIEEQIEGTLSAFLNTLGYVAINFEAGQHDDPASIDRHESAIWLSLVSSGCLRADQVPQMEKHIHQLTKATKGLPKIFESRFRYAIQDWEQFRMQPGFANFQKVRKGQLLAKSDDRQVVAPMKGRIFMPLYQAQGNDGFFIIRPIRPIWLTLSVRARKLHLDHWLPLLPGIERDPELPDTLIINKRIARFFSLQVFHLLGYRKVRQIHHKIYVTRRKYDFEGPETTVTNR